MRVWMREHRALKLKAVLACLLLFGFTGCGGAEQTGSAGYTADAVTFSYVATPLNIPSIVEKQQGTFAAAFEPLGVSTDYAAIDAGATQMAALASGDLQILPAAGAASALLAAANGADVKIIGIYSRSPQAFMLFSKDESIDSPQALAGKTVAGAKGSNLHELLAAYLATAGMTMADVNFVATDMPGAMAALENGSADAALLAGVPGYKCLKAGKHLVTNGEGLTAGTIVAVTTQKFYDENPVLVETFLAARDEVLSYMAEHPDEAMQAAAEELGLTPEAVADMAAMYDFSAEMTAEDVADLNHAAQFLYDAQLIDREISAEELLLQP